jgi:hypothetical protein
MSKAYRSLPPVEQLWELFSLDPLTGTLYWRKHRNSKRIGKPFGCIYSGGYIVGEIKNIRFPAHRLIWKWVKGTEPQEVDHIDHRRSNNTPWNLRSVSRSGNHCNRTGVKGWTQTPCGRYKALACIDKKQRYLGTFDTKEEARAAYEAAVALLHTPLLQDYLVA